MPRDTLTRPRRALLLPLACLLALSAAAQSEGEPQEGPRPHHIVVEPESLELSVGQKARITARVVAEDGSALDEELVYFSRARRSVSVTSEGEVEALGAGDFELVVRTARRLDLPADDDENSTRKRRLSTRVPVTIERLPIEAVILEPFGRLYAGTTLPVGAMALDTRGVPQPDVPVELSTDPPGVASIDRYGRLALHAAGRFTLSARCEQAESGFVDIEVLPYPVAELHISAEREHARTGDVVHAHVLVRDARGETVEGYPVDVSVLAEPADALGPKASGQVRANRDAPGDWRFVADTPGRYTLVATTAKHVAKFTLEVEERDVRGKLSLLGRGRVAETHTSDLWVWEAVDGRDYAVTGTWGANGEAIFWDVTDPTAIERVATITVDARTVNDVKVSADGKLCVISREGASNRKNGIVLIDVTNPREPEVIGSYDEGLTGGVHNLFIYGQHVYALSNGRRYDIVDVSNPREPRTVGKYELTTPGHAIHDVWVVDGLAYSSNWSDGVHIVDVGNGIKGGSPENPVYVADMTYPSGWNHAAFPYKNSETGRSYVVAGDEAFPFGLNITERPTYPRGWLHFFDVTDAENPEEIARYEVPEAGTHNFWIEDDVAYVAYYNGGLRVVDLSGEVMGDLYRQGREMAALISDDPEGHIPNAPMVWGPQPHKGTIFFSDWNSGLWAARFEPQGSAD